MFGKIFSGSKSSDKVSSRGQDDDDTVSVKSSGRRKERSDRSTVDDGPRERRKKGSSSIKSSSRGDDRSERGLERVSTIDTDAMSERSSRHHHRHHDGDEEGERHHHHHRSYDSGEEHHHRHHHGGDDDEYEGSKETRRRKSKYGSSTDLSSKKSRDTDGRKSKRRDTDPENGALESSRAAFDAPEGPSGFDQFPGQSSAQMPGMPGGIQRMDSDHDHSLSTTNQGHVPSMFPGQFPTETAVPFRPPLASHEGGPGLAAEYYADNGESVHHQPGARPHTPVIAGAQPHLQSASQQPNPPEEPSQSGAVGAAASYFNGGDMGNTPDRPSKPGKSKPGKSKPSRPSQSSSNGLASTAGAAAAGAAAGYFMSGAQPNGNNSQHNTGNGSSRPPSDRPSSYYTAPGGQQPAVSPAVSPGTLPPKNSHTGMYAAGAAAAGAAALAAYEHHEHNQHNHQNSQSGHQYGVSDEYSKPPPGFHYTGSHYSDHGYVSTGNGYASGPGAANGAVGMAQQHRHRGPIAKFVDFFRDPDGVAKFEEYTEYIGVCRYCFDPRSSPRDAPRKHHYGRSRKSWENLNRSRDSLHSRKSWEKMNGSRTSLNRVDKDNRYGVGSEKLSRKSSGKLERRQSDREMSRKASSSGVLPVIAGVGAAGVIADKLSKRKTDFDDTYSVKHADDDVLRIRRDSSEERNGRSTSYGVLSRKSERRESKGEAVGVDRNGKTIYRKPSLKDTRKDSGKRRSSREKDDKKSHFAEEAAGAAALGIAAYAATRPSKNRRGSHSSSSSVSSRKRRVSSRPSKEKRGFFGSLFGASSSAPKRSGSRKNRRDSSADSHLVFESDRQRYGSDRQSKRKTRKRNDSPGITSASEARDAVRKISEGVVIANALKNQKSQSMDLKDSKNAHKIYEQPDRRRHASEPEDAEWTDESDEESVDLGLGYHDEHAPGWWPSYGRKERSPSPVLRDREHSHTPPSARFAEGAIAGVAGAAALHSLKGRSPGRDSSYSGNGSTLPLKEVEPRPIGDTPQHSNERPAPTPVQKIYQPQPVSPVKKGVYNATNIPGEFPDDQSPTREIQPELSHRRKRSSGGGEAGSSVRFHFTEEERERHDRADREHEDRLRQRELKKGVEYGEGEPPKKRREVERLSEKEERERQRQQDALESKQSEIERRERELSELKAKKDSSSGVGTAALVGGAGAIVGAALLANHERNKSNHSPESHQERREKRRQQRREPYEREQPYGDDYSVASIDSRKDKLRQDQPESDDERFEDSRDYRHHDESPERGREGRNTDLNKEELASAGLSRVARKAADIVRRTPSPAAHESYAEFFAPVKDTDGQNRRVDPMGDNDVEVYHADVEGGVVPEVVTIEPKEVSQKRSTSPFTFPGDESYNPDVSKLKLPWMVPPVKLIRPTPEPSPRIQPVDDEEMERVEQVDKPSNSSTRSDTFDDEQARDYQSRSQEEGHRDLAKEAAEVGAGAAVAAAVAVAATENAKKKKKKKDKKSRKDSDGDFGEESPRKDIERDEKEYERDEKDRRREESGHEREEDREREEGDREHGHMPGGFGNDIEFAGVLARGLEDSGFDPNIVIDDPKYHKRESPPGSGDEFGRGGSETRRRDRAEDQDRRRRSPLEEVLGYRPPSPGTEGAPPVQGFVEPESVPDTPADEVKKDLSRSNTQDREENRGTNGVSRDIDSSVPENLVKEEVEPPRKLSKKERKKEEKRKSREASAAEAAVAAAVGGAAVATAVSSMSRDDQDDVPEQDREPQVAPVKEKKLSKAEKRRLKNAAKWGDQSEQVQDNDDENAEMDIIDDASREPDEWSTGTNKKSRKRTKELFEKAVSHNDDEFDIINDAASEEPALKRVVEEAALQKKQKEEPSAESTPRETPSPSQSRDEFFDAEAGTQDDGIRTPTKDSFRPSTPSAAGVPLPDEDGAVTPTYERMARSQELPGNRERDLVYDSPSEYSHAATDIGPERHRHHHHRRHSSRHDGEDDSRSAVSAPTRHHRHHHSRDEERESPREEKKKGSIFNIFSKKIEEVADKRSAREEAERKEREEAERNERRGKKKHRRSKDGASVYGSDDDAASVSSHRSRSKRHSRHSEKEEGDRPAKSGSDDRDVHYEAEDQSFLDERPEPTRPPDRREHDMDAAGRDTLAGLGLMAGTAAVAGALAHREGGSGHVSPTRSQDDLELPRLGASPSLEATPIKHRRPLSHTQSEIGSLMGPSPTAVPLVFRRPPASRHGSTQSTPAKPPSSPATPVSKKEKRPGSKEFAGKADVRPLYLVERHNKPVQVFDPEEEFPELPPSRGTSRASSANGGGSPKQLLEEPALPPAIVDQPDIRSTDVETSRSIKPDDISDGQQMTSGTALTADERKRREAALLDAALQERVSAELEWQQRQRKESAPTKEHIPGESSDLPQSERPESPSSTAARYHREPSKSDPYQIPPYQAKEESSRDLALGAGLVGAVGGAAAISSVIRNHKEHEEREDRELEAEREAQIEAPNDATPLSTFEDKDGLEAPEEIHEQPTADVERKIDPSEVPLPHGPDENLEEVLQEGDATDVTKPNVKDAPREAVPTDEPKDAVTEQKDIPFEADTITSSAMNEDSENNEGYAPGKDTKSSKQRKKEKRKAKKLAIEAAAATGGLLGTAAVMDELTRDDSKPESSSTVAKDEAAKTEEDIPRELFEKGTDELGADTQDVSSNVVVEPSATVQKEANTTDEWPEDNEVAQEVGSEKARKEAKKNKKKEKKKKKDKKLEPEEAAEQPETLVPLGPELENPDDSTMEPEGRSVEWPMANQDSKEEDDGFPKITPEIAAAHSGLPNLTQSQGFSYSTTPQFDYGQPKQADFKYKKPIDSDEPQPNVEPAAGEREIAFGSEDKPNHASGDVSQSMDGEPQPNNEDSLAKDPESEEAAVGDTPGAVLDTKADDIAPIPPKDKKTKKQAEKEAKKAAKEAKKAEKDAKKKNRKSKTESLPLSDEPSPDPESNGKDLNDAPIGPESEPAFTEPLPEGSRNVENEQGADKFEMTPENDPPVESEQPIEGPTLEVTSPVHDNAEPSEPKRIKPAKRVSWPAEHELVSEHEISAPPSGIQTPAELVVQIPQAIKDMPRGLSSDNMESPSWDISPETNDEWPVFGGKKNRKKAQEKNGAGVKENSDDVVDVNPEDIVSQEITGESSLVENQPDAENQGGEEWLEFKSPPGKKGKKASRKLKAAQKAKTAKILEETANEETKKETDNIEDPAETPMLEPSPSKENPFSSQFGEAAEVAGATVLAASALDGTRQSESAPNGEDDGLGKDRSLELPDAEETDPEPKWTLPGGTKKGKNKKNRQSAETIEPVNQTEPEAEPELEPSSLADKGQSQDVEVVKDLSEPSDPVPDEIQKGGADLDSEWPIPKKDKKGKNKKEKGKKAKKPNDFPEPEFQPEPESLTSTDKDIDMETVEKEIPAEDTFQAAEEVENEFGPANSKKAKKKSKKDRKRQADQAAYVSMPDPEPFQDVEEPEDILAQDAKGTKMDVDEHESFLHEASQRRLPSEDEDEFVDYDPELSSVPMDVDEPQPTNEDIKNLKQSPSPEIEVDQSKPMQESEEAAKEIDTQTETVTEPDTKESEVVHIPGSFEDDFPEPESLDKSIPWAESVADEPHIENDPTEEPTSKTDLVDRALLPAAIESEEQPKESKGKKKKDKKKPKTPWGSNALNNDNTGLFDQPEPATDEIPSQDVTQDLTAESNLQEPALETQDDIWEESKSLKKKKRSKKIPEPSLDDVPPETADETVSQDLPRSVPDETWITDEPLQEEPVQDETLSADPNQEPRSEPQGRKKNKKDKKKKESKQSLPWDDPREATNTEDVSVETRELPSNEEQVPTPSAAAYASELIADEAENSTPATQDQEVDETTVEGPESADSEFKEAVGPEEHEEPDVFEDALPGTFPENEDAINTIEAQEADRGNAMEPTDDNNPGKKKSKKQRRLEKQKRQSEAFAQNRNEPPHTDASGPFDDTSATKHGFEEAAAIAAGAAGAIGGIAAMEHAPETQPDGDDWDENKGGKKERKKKRNSEAKNQDWFEANEQKADEQKGEGVSTEPEFAQAEDISQDEPPHLTNSPTPKETIDTEMPDNVQGTEKEQDQVADDAWFEASDKDVSMAEGVFPEPEETHVTKEAEEEEWVEKPLSRKQMKKQKKRDSKATKVGKSKDPISSFDAENDVPAEDTVRGDYTMEESATASQGEPAKVEQDAIEQLAPEDDRLQVDPPTKPSKADRKKEKEREKKEKKDKKRKNKGLQIDDSSAEQTQSSTPAENEQQLGPREAGENFLDSLQSRPENLNEESQAVETGLLTPADSQWADSSFYRDRSQEFSEPPEEIREEPAKPTKKKGKKDKKNKQKADKKLEEAQQKSSQLLWEEPAIGPVLAEESQAAEDVEMTEEPHVTAAEDPFNDNTFPEISPVKSTERELPQEAEDLPDWDFNNKEDAPREEPMIDNPKRRSSQIAKGGAVAAALAMFEGEKATGLGLHRSSTVRHKEGRHHHDKPHEPELPAYTSTDEQAFTTPKKETDEDRSLVDSTSKERSSAALFSSSPSIRDTPRHRHHRSLEDITSERPRSMDRPKSIFGGSFPNEDYEAMKGSPVTPGQSTPLMTITEQSPEEQGLSKQRRLDSIKNPKRRSFAHLSEHRHNSLQSEHDKARRLGHISGDDLHAQFEADGQQAAHEERRRASSGRHERPRSIVTSGDINPEYRTFSGASMRSSDSISAVIRDTDRPTSASPSLRREKRSVSSDLRRASGGSNQFGETERSAKKSISPKPDRDAKGASSEEMLAGVGLAGVAAAAAGFASSSNYDPATDKGKGRAIEKMANVYEAWGEVPGSPRSPSRPPSVRKRQSLQILDLETRLESLVSENRQLSEARSRAERQLDNINQDHSGSIAAQQEAIRTRDTYLQQKDSELEELRNVLNGLQGEVARLTQVNQELTAEQSSAINYEEQYKQLQAEHEQSRQLHEESTRELEDMRTKHSSMSRGMEGIVAAEVATAVAAAKSSKDSEIDQLRSELESAKEQIRTLQQQILEARNSSADDDDVLVTRDEDYFDKKCQQLCQHVQQWVLRFSKFSDRQVARSIAQVQDERTVDRFEYAMLDGTEVDDLLRDRVRRRDVFMAVVMAMIFEFVFSRYLFGMDREQRQKLKSLEKTLGEVGSPAAVNKWRATTLTLLSRRDKFRQQREDDTQAVVQEIFDTLSSVLPPPVKVAEQLTLSLGKVMQLAVDLAVEMRTQRAEFQMLPPLQPEYDTKGDLKSTVRFRADLMNERSGAFESNEQVEQTAATVRIVLFPLVVKRGSDDGTGDEEVVVCPAQVLVAREDDGRANRKSGLGVNDDAMKSRMSIAASTMGASEGGMF